MRFKVTPKDFMLFCVYCVILLYFCALAISNFASWQETGSFSGLFPIDAFFPKNIGYTFALFIAVLIMIFTSVSSYIFDKDKGGSLGLHFGDKSSDGYSKWATEKDIKTDKGIVRVCPSDSEIKAAGIPLINKGREMWVDNGEYHNLIIGSSGSGKTECIVKPLVNLLSRKGESMVITDPKGEIYEFCGEYLKSQGYKIVILNFRDPQKGNAWNPLTLPYQYYTNGNKDKGIELLDDVAKNIFHEKNAQEAFWGDSAGDYFAGLALGLFDDAKADEVNLSSINYVASVGEERRGTSNYIKEYFGLKGESSQAYVFASNTFTAPNETKGSILSTFRQKIRIFSTKESLSEMLAYSDFDMRDIGKEKTAVFMIIHDEKKTYHGLMTIFLKQCYETLIDCAFENGGKLEYRTNFILDEFANMPELKDVDSMVTAARSRDIRFTFIIQNFAQLNDVYGEEIAQVIKGNCGNLVYLISTELKALEEISKMCGEVKSKEKDKTASTPLVTVSDLQKMKLFQAIIIRWRKNPFKTQLTPDFKIDWGNKMGKASLPQREAKDVELFDLKAFVSDKKKDETLNKPGMGMGMGMPGNSGGGNPFLNGGFNPFLQPASTPKMEPIKPANEEKSNPYSNINDKELDDIIKNIEKTLAEEDKKAEEAKKSKEEEKKTVKEEKAKIEIPSGFFDDLDEEIEIPESKPIKEEKEEPKEIPKEDKKESLNDFNSTEDEFKHIFDSKYEDKDEDYEEIATPIKEKPLTEDMSIEDALKEIEEEEKESKKLVHVPDEPKELTKEEEQDLTQEITMDDNPIIDIDKESEVINENVVTTNKVTDDEYFDDFFDN